jgi:hypothetical protein
MESQEGRAVCSFCGWQVCVMGPGRESREERYKRRGWWYAYFTKFGMDVCFFQ